MSQDELALVPARESASAVVKIVLPPERASDVSAIVGALQLDLAPGTALVTFGQEPISALNARLDAMLEQVTKADSPVLFELFRRVSSDVRRLDLPGVEAEIRQKMEGGPVQRFMSALGLGNKARGLEAATEEIRQLLQNKTQSLLDLLRPMESQINTESTKLIGEINRLGQQSAEYRESIVELGVYVEAGRQILATARERLAALEADAQTSGDPIAVRDAKDFQTKVDLFENRLLALETAFARAPVDLESIGIAQSAGLLTLADTVSSAQTEFNDIKSALLRLHATFQIRSLQQLNTVRRQLRADLQKYSLQQLETVAVETTASAAQARLDDATLLREMATALEAISHSVTTEREKNRAKADEVRAMLVEAQQAISAVRQPARVPAVKQLP